MSSKLFTIVLAVITVVPFAYFVTQHAVSVTHDLQEQNAHIKQLNTESVQLDKKLNTTQETKKQAKQEVDQLEDQTQSAVAERKKLEAELRVN